MSEWSAEKGTCFQTNISVTSNRFLLNFGDVRKHMGSGSRRSQIFHLFILQASSLSKKDITGLKNTILHLYIQHCSKD